MPESAPHRPSPRPLQDFAAAVGFLTLLPIGRRWPDDRQPRSVGWYPWVGWLLGGLVTAPLWALTRLQGPIAGTKALMCAAVVVAAWALLTRFLHWDGLADAADGLWGGHTPASRLEIMRDSRIGSFGAVAVVMTALLQVAAAALLVERGALWVLVAAPVLGRLAAALAAWQLPSARNEGLGLTAMGPPGPYDALVAAMAVLALLALVPLGAPALAFLVALTAGLLAGILVPRALARPVGGMTGDLFGATVILVETVVLLIGAVIL
jgi:adenosylcobinamide-GDP ribazoletransferase